MVVYPRGVASTLISPLVLCNMFVWQFLYQIAKEFVALKTMQVLIESIVFCTDFLMFGGIDT